MRLRTSFLLIALTITTALAGGNHATAQPSIDIDDAMCNAFASPAQAAEHLGIEREFFLHDAALADTRGGSCEWGVHDEWAGPGCQHVSADRRAKGDCIERLARLSINCAPEEKLNSTAVEWVKTSGVLGGEAIDVGDVGFLKSGRVIFAQQGCVVQISRLRSMDLTEGYEGDELNRQLVLWAQRIASVLAGSS